jgi:hypothetical protein
MLDQHTGKKLSNQKNKIREPKGKRKAKVGVHIFSKDLPRATVEE